jgi:IS30 family transposase
MGKKEKQMLVRSWRQLLEILFYQKKMRITDIATILNRTPPAISMELKKSKKRRVPEQFDEQEFLMSLDYSSEKLANKVLGTIKNVRAEVIEEEDKFKIVVK